MLIIAAVIVLFIVTTVWSGVLDPRIVLLAACGGGLLRLCSWLVADDQAVSWLGSVAFVAVYLTSTELGLDQTAAAIQLMALMFLFGGAIFLLVPARRGEPTGAG
jgi:hypothetical protein